jgi:transcriptional regulator with XRE-family HTH domain
MPAKAPPSGPKIKKALSQLGQQIRVHRKSLKVSAIATAEAAGVSRMTLNRIERGEPSVTMGAYLNVVSALGLNLSLGGIEEPYRDAELSLDTKIRVTDFPQLKKLAWQLKKTEELSPKETLNIYERSWRHINLKEMEKKEQELIQKLLTLFGKERLLV